MSTETNETYAESRDTTEGRVFTVTGGDWESVTKAIDPLSQERLVVNMGPQHPSTHGVLRLVLELEGETVTEARVVVGYLHTGIEKNIEYRTWTQGTTFVTRCDYLSPIHNELGFCLAVEKLLGIEDQITDRTNVIRVMMSELNRISSHLIWLATTGMELGALTMMIFGFREREKILDIFEAVSGLRMNMAYIRPGGLSNDVPDHAVALIEQFLKDMPGHLREYEDLLGNSAIWQERTQGVAYLDVSGCLALGVTGPVLRSAGLPWDLRKTMPYCGYETYDFDVATHNGADVWGRYMVRMEEIRQSLRIVRQCLDRLEPGPIMVADKKIAWPAQLALGTDGLGNSLNHVKHIMGQSMESLIHHFKLVTEGFRVPAGQAYVAIEAPRGEFGVHAVSEGGTRPHRIHMREPSFINLQAIPAMAEGALIADVIAGGASLDPVMGGCDR
ncbi:NADH-quinone oxidoreductase subunit D 2 [Actinorhabdospora filicis]|uniref:NADH-quinone oxidoreductase subunit D n=1 Tax=Actinorhabdospora filicis TaxID=1785913 RepID=A0A9W6WBK8_9ACTN|nr:NADH-quinone oxidoreductase subunit D [Actinorhabdospora filicis]GLZ80719.1 NADH-quinone oxidoreductase subunit D 2 [Actinorhabdospora filicis]